LEAENSTPQQARHRAFPGAFRILPGRSTAHSVYHALPVPELPGGREMGLRATRARELGPGRSPGVPLAIRQLAEVAEAEQIGDVGSWVGACKQCGFCIERFCFFSIDSATPVVFKPGQKRSSEEPLPQQQPQGIETGTGWGKWAMSACEHLHGCAQKPQPTFLRRRISQSGQQARAPCPVPKSKEKPLTVRAQWTTTRNVSTQLVRNRA